MIFSARSERKITKELIRQLVLGFFGLLMITPLVWMVLTSLKTRPEIMRYPPTLLPNTLVWEHYINVFTTTPIGRYFLNSLIVAGTITVVYLFLCSLGGYVFVKTNIRGRNLIFVLIFLSSIMPITIRAIPLYQMMSSWNWVDTYQALIVPELIGGFGVFFMGQSIRAVPDVLIDAAKIDGCSFFGIYSRIILPSIKVPLSALFVFQFMWMWRSLFWPVIIVESEGMKTLELGIATYMVFTGGILIPDYGPYMSFAGISILPIVIVFLFMQRYFVKSIVMTGIKG